MNMVIELLKEYRNRIELELPFEKKMLRESCGSDMVQIIRRKSVKNDEEFLRQINEAILILQTPNP